VEAVLIQEVEVQVALVVEEANNNKVAQPAGVEAAEVAKIPALSTKMMLLY